MDRNEAKAILELHRPGRDDDREDPLIAEALKLLDQDAELRDWFEAQQAIDARIAEGLARIEPPAHLKAHILAGMRAHALEASHRKQAEAVPASILPGAHDHMDHPTTSPAWWRNPWVGIAAVFALLFTLAVIPRNDPGGQGIAAIEPLPSSAQQAGIPGMIDFLAAHFDSVPYKPFDKSSDRPDDLKAYLASLGTPAPRSLPAPVGEKPSIGCFALEYNGAKMGIICFNNGQVVHLTTVMKTDCMGEFPAEPAIYETRGQAFKVWTEDREVYILSVEGSKENLPDWI